MEINTAEIDTADSAATAIERLSPRPFDVCLVDATWDTATVADLVNRIQAAHRSTQVVRLSDAAEETGASAASPWKSFRSCRLPLVRRLLRSALQKAKLQSENRSLKRQLQVRVLSEIIGQSEAANQLREAIRAAADEDGCVLIHGEPGAGSQQVARVVHLAGRRASVPSSCSTAGCTRPKASSGNFWAKRLAPSRFRREPRKRAASPAGRAERCCLKNIETLPLSAQKKLAGILAASRFPVP